MTSSAQLLVSQRNEIYRHIQEAGQSPDDFGWDETPSAFMETSFGVATRVPKLVHGATGYYYAFDLKGDKHHAFLSPGSDTAQESRYPGSWEYQLQYFDNWLSYIARETAAGDLWARLVAEVRVVARTPLELAATPLTQVEIGHISKQLDALGERVDAIAGTTHCVASEIGYLKMELARQSRRDWFFMFVGVLATVGTGLALAPEQVTAMVAYLKSVLADVQVALGGGK